MKKIIIITLIILNIFFYVPISAQNKKLPLNNLVISIDSGHGGKDVGSSYNKILEKDINLSIAKYLKNELESAGATIIMTRDGDYDLSSPNSKRRKKSDFDNRIKIINEADTDLFISIHQNNFSDTKYSGLQIFYKGNKTLADELQKNINPSRKTSKISNKLYMYNKLDSDGLLIECGFLSNYKDRLLLTNKKYQKELAQKITKNIIKHYKNN